MRVRYSKDRCREQELEYACTNESLDAIVAGLDIISGDNILSVGGSGDQAFAMLEIAGLVYVMDTSSAQVNHVKKRTTLLDTGDYHGFLDVGINESRLREINPAPDLEARNSYFLEKDRLDIIRANLHKLTVDKGNLLNAFFIDSFPKIYLSNTLGYKMLTRVARGLYNPAEDLRNVALNLSPGGLLYVSNNGTLVRLLKKESDDLEVPGLVLDEERTRMANNLETEFTPGVYRKAA